MNNQIQLFLTSVAFLLFSVWGVTELLTIHDTRVQFAILGTVGIFIALLTIKASIPLDGKLLIFVMFGYFIGGKGFAYLSPKEPIYIGEIFFAFAALGYLVRTKFNPKELFARHVLISLIVFICLYGLLRLMHDFSIFGMNAIRDGAMIYYSALALFMCFLFDDARFRKIFEKLFIPALLLGLFSTLFKGLGLRGILVQKIPLLGQIYAPHVDIGIPVVLSVFFWSTFLLFRKKQFSAIICIALCLFIIATGKSAYAFALILVSALLIIFAQFRYLFIAGGAAITLLALFVTIAHIAGSDFLTSLRETDMGTTLAVGDSRGSGTTTWRLEWWKTVTRDTMAEAPWMGLGLGGDITTNFIMEYSGVSQLDIVMGNIKGFTRYPHNIFFTVLGRLGIVGCIGLLIYIYFFVRFSIQYVREFFINENVKTFDIAIFSFVFAGFCNSFVQSTYENPYAGIMHWVCVGYMLNRYYWKKKVTIKNKMN